MNVTFRSHLLLPALMIAAAGSFPACAQKSAYQSSDGQTSLYLDQGSAAIINFGDSKFSFGGNRRTKKHNLLYGFEAYGKASGGQSTLLSSKIKTPEGGADIIFGLHPTGKRIDQDPNRFHRDNWLLVDGGYSRASFYVAPGPQPLDSAKIYFHRYRAMAAYNHIVAGWFMFGAAGGVERRNNLDDLKQVTFQSSLSTAGSDSVVKQQSGYLGSYQQYRAAPLYGDLLFILPEQLPPFGGRLAVDVFTRSDLAPSHRYGDGGVGLFLTKKDAPTKVLGGVAASWNDGKIKVALVASYSF